VWLVGLPGAGKSAVGQELARRLRVAFLDLDAAVEEAHGGSIARIFAEVGEEGFRDLESKALAAAAAAPEGVVAAGGGAVLRETNVATMHAAGSVVWLRAGVDELVRRIGDDAGRPLLAGGSLAERLTELAAAREVSYRAAASVVVETGGRTIEDIVDEVARWIGS
jgi:shikimate kinase